MDPFTAIGLAGNIAQFIDFSCKLFSSARSIYNSKTGLQSDVESLQDLTDHLQELCTKLKPSPSAPNSPSIVPAELKILAGKCGVAANELLLLLGELSAGSNKSKGKSFQAALKMEWKKERIMEMSSRLDSYRMQLILQLQFLQR